MNPGVPNWEAMNQPKTENPHLWDPAYGLPAGASAEAGGKPFGSHGKVRASPMAVEWDAPSRALYRFECQVIRPCSVPDKNWDADGPGRSDEPVFTYEWAGSGRNAVTSGPPRSSEVVATSRIGSSYGSCLY